MLYTSEESYRVLKYIFSKFPSSSLNLESNIPVLFRPNESLSARLPWLFHTLFLFHHTTWNQQLKIRLSAQSYTAWIFGFELNENYGNLSDMFFQHFKIHSFYN